MFKGGREKAKDLARRSAQSHQEKAPNPARPDPSVRFFPITFVVMDDLLGQETALRMTGRVVFDF
jgi:hypothetical protein